MESPITIDQSLCTACGLCGTVCPRHVPVTEERNGTKTTAPSPDRVHICFACGQCASVCPKGAITVDGLPRDGFAPLPEWSVSPEDLLSMLQTRRSVRRYKDKPVPREVLERLVEAVGYAPTGAARCTNGVIVITSKEILAELAKNAHALYTKLEGAMSNPIGKFVVKRKVGKGMLHVLEDFLLPAFHQYHQWYEEGREEPLTRDAPAVMLFTTPSGEPEGGENAAIACYHAVMMAHTMGLGTCINGLIPPSCNRSPEQAELIGLGPDRVVHIALTLGYPKIKYKRVIPRHVGEVKYL